MRFDIRKPQERTYKIDGKNKVFLGTVYYGEDFEFHILPPTREQLLAIQAQDDPDWHFFQTVIVDWANVLDQEGNPIECNEDSKAVLLDYMPTFVSSIIAAIRHRQLGIKSHSDKEEETEKNSEASSSGIAVLGGKLANHADSFEDAN